MKKVIMLAAVIAALASCQSEANKTAEAGADSLPIKMAPIIEVTEAYESILPAADGSGIDYVLALNVTTDGVDTTCILDIAYLSAEGQGKNKTFPSRGKQQTIQKVVNKKLTKAVKLTLNNGEAPVYFAIINDITLRSVNDSSRETISDPDYNIIKVKK